MEQSQNQGRAPEPKQKATTPEPKRVARGRPKKVDEAIAILSNDPDAATMTLRELQARYGIGRTVWSEAKKALSV